MKTNLLSAVCLAAIAGGIHLSPAAALAGDTPKVLLNEAEFRDRVYACWMGKNIGGTLGMPFEGKQQANHIDFYTNLKPGQPEANDDLDLAILWLKAMEEHHGRVDARILGEYWLKYVPVDWNEYGVGKKNMRRGFLPPLCGQFDNAQWRPSNGAWIRSELWASLAPGCPAIAARIAREDACVDHGAAEGTLAELFTAALQSAAFVEPNRDRLVDIGLAMIPPDCETAVAIRAVVAARKAGKDWEAARQDVLQASRKTGWFQSPRNVGFVVLGLLYGEGDFGRSVCTTVNCGDDTDSTGATVGSTLGILLGTKGIPAKWTAPIGTSIKNVAISGFDPPKDIGTFTDRTVAMTRRVLAQQQLPVALTSGPTDLRHVKELVLVDTTTARRLWAMSPYVVVWNEPSFQAALDYGDEPLVAAGAARRLQLKITNRGDRARAFEVALAGVPGGWRLEGLPRTVTVQANGTDTMPISLTATTVEAGDYRMTVRVAAGDVRASIPLTLVGRETISPDDLALASKGATATSDGELAREPGCTGRAIDGILTGPTDFDARRWHSSIDTPHPHWIQVKLPKPALVGRVIVHFADPEGYPVNFEGMVLPEGKSEMVQVFREDGYKNPRSYRKEITPVKTDTFRLVIHASANPKYPNAAQISEIELCPPAAR